MITEAPKLDPNIAEGLAQRPENIIRSLVNERAVGPDVVSVKLLKITDHPQW